MMVAVVVVVAMVAMPISAPIAVVFFVTVVFFILIAVVMLCAVGSHVRAAMVPPVRAPMTSAMRSNMDRGGGVVVVIIVSLCNSSEADYQGNRSGDWRGPSDIKAAVHDAYSS